LILTCENCSRRYSLAEEMIRGKAIKLRCKGCQQIITVPAAPGSAAAAKSPAPPAARASAKKDAAVLSDGLSAVTRMAEGESWFAMIKGRQTGPLLARDLAGRFKAGEIGRRTYVWREGMADWKRAEDVAELLAIFEPEKWVPAPAEEVSLQHRRESFEELAQATNPVVQGRPLPGLKLSPQMLAASPQPRRDFEPEASQPTPSDLASPGEETRFFISEAGMHKRNPPWKIAAFVVALIALPLAVLYLLAAFQVVPLTVTRVDSSGREGKESVFSSGGVSALGDLLTGRGRTAHPVAPGGESRPGRVPPKAPVASLKTVDIPPAPLPSPSPSPPPSSKTTSTADLRALYGDGSKGDVGPVVRRQKEKRVEAADGLGQREVARVVSQTQPAFRFCIEQEMKRNPSFRGGKIFINALVGSSGTVKQAAISRPDIDSSSLGQCLKSKARRMVFAAFAGDDTEVQIPLILTTSL